jgi:hypothetical protein
MSLLPGLCIFIQGKNYPSSKSVQLLLTRVLSFCTAIMLIDIT